MDAKHPAQNLNEQRESGLEVISGKGKRFVCLFLFSNGFSFLRRDAHRKPSNLVGNEKWNTTMDSRKGRECRR